jgi:hypothetical protein
LATRNALGPDDYKALAQIMAGPHGRLLSPQTPADILVVFCCADPEVGRTAARLYREHLVRRAVFSGRVGKDSGGLPALGITEAAFLASIAIAEGLPTDAIVLEEEAKNGAENAAFALRLAAKLGYLPPGTQVAGLAPAERSRRLYEELRYQAAAGHFAADVAAGLSSGSADSADPSTRDELVRELRGLATMHQGETPRISRQPEFQQGGKYRRLIEKAGVAS